MVFFYALLFLRPSFAVNAVKARRRADTATVCQQILARDRFDLDDVIARGLVEALKPDVYRFVGSEIDPFEVEALERLIQIKGGRALAIGAFGTEVGVPVVDAVHYEVNGASRLLSIKTSVKTRTNGISFIRGQVFRRKTFARRLLTREGLSAHYRLADPGPTGFSKFNQQVMEAILRVWNLQRVPRPRVTFLLDLTPACTLSPTVGRAGDVFADVLGRARANDRVLMVSHNGQPLEGLPRVFNLDSFTRDLTTDEQFAGAIILFRHHYCEVDQDGFDLRERDDEALPPGRRRRD